MPPTPTHAWFKRPLGAATFAWGAGLLHDTTNGADKAAHVATRKKPRRDQVFCAGRSSKEAFVTEAVPLGLMDADCRGSLQIASISLGSTADKRRLRVESARVFSHFVAK
jgi:hypothetical protein